MGRASNPGAPQRVSAHVVPKLPSFSADDEEEKTTIESGGWEEEASTTVEQGDVADKIRALGIGLDQARRANTSITSTNGGGMSDEPTVDDQRGAAALAMLPPPLVARLVITQGNDAGQAIEVRLGKTYTIGRGIDNDLVLTDIAVSRKHFDIRNENGSWVLADRGSGNGTLVNHRIEDAPFMLASGDVIEIGNTSFRFDMPNGTPRAQPSYDGSPDDDLELSTVSGKPLPEPATPAQIVAPVQPIVPLAPAATAPQPRPKTLPPPSPLPRPRTHTGRPALAGYALDRPGHTAPAQPQQQPSGLSPALAATMSPMHGPQILHAPQALPIQLQPQPQTTLPLPQMANRPPLPPAPLLDLPMSSLPTTIPGQGPPMQPAHPARLPFTYPVRGPLDSQRQQAVPVTARNAMLVASGQPGRDATSTALVQPISYTNNSQPAVVPQQPYSNQVPPLSRRVKLVLGGAGLALFAAIATIAIIRGTSGSGGHATEIIHPTPREPHPIVEPIRDPGSIKAIEPPRAPRDPKDPNKARTITPIAPSVPPAPPAPVKLASPTAPPAAAALPPPTAPATPTSTSPAPPPTATPATPPTAAPAKLATSLPTTPAPALATPSTPPTAPPAMPPTAAPTPARVTAPIVAPIDPLPPKVAVAPPPPSPARIAPTAPIDPPAPRVARAELAAQTPKADKRTPKHPEPKKSERRTPAAPRIEADHTDRPETAPATNRPDKKHGKSTQELKNEANNLYRAKNFSGAAAIITSSLSAFTTEDAQELKSIAAIYSQLGKAYNVGMAPGTKATDAFVALGRAIDFDRAVGAAYVDELRERQAVMSTKAAGSYMAAKEYESAFQAVRISESLGSTSPSNKTVRTMLEALASDLLRDAQSTLASDPEGAKKKLRQILGIVETKNSLHVRAQKLLNGS
jgi:type III secretion system (T3SS) inner membrane Yop/YscD-like protein